MSVKPTVTSSGRATTGRREGDRALALAVGRRGRKHIARGRMSRNGPPQPLTTTIGLDLDAAHLDLDRRR
jgi:hypothetical protein